MTPAIGMLLLWAWSAISKRVPSLASASAAPWASVPPPARPPYQAPRPRPNLTVSPGSTAQSAAAAAIATQALSKPSTAAKPMTITQALQASHTAAQKLATQAEQLRAAAKAAPPWPASKPLDLPPWPAGWEADKPPPPAVVTRAWQLLPVLWKKGKGTKSVETIKGRWITFVAEDHGGGKKGVTAYRIKAAFAK